MTIILARALDVPIGLLAVGGLLVGLIGLSLLLSDGVIWLARRLSGRRG